MCGEDFVSIKKSLLFTLENNGLLSSPHSTQHTHPDTQTFMMMISIMGHIPTYSTGGDVTNTNIYLGGKKYYWGCGMAHKSIL